MHSCRNKQHVLWCVCGICDVETQCWELTVHNLQFWCDLLEWSETICGSSVSWRRFVYASPLPTTISSWLPLSISCLCSLYTAASQHVPSSVTTFLANMDSFIHRVGKSITHLLLWSHHIKSNQKVNLYSTSSIKNSQTRHLHISTLKQPCLKSTLELFPGNITAS